MGYSMEVSISLHGVSYGVLISAQDPSDRVPIRDGIGSEFFKPMSVSVRFGLELFKKWIGSVRRKCESISSETGIPIHFLAF
jgi:hypothetical protein